MNAVCIDDDGNFKACPFRIFHQEHMAITIGSSGSGGSYTEKFYPCIGQECAAYHVGVCLRLIPALKEVPLQQMPVF